jgi:hypothetical protein
MSIQQPWARQSFVEIELVRPIELAVHASYKTASPGMVAV